MYYIVEGSHCKDTYRVYKEDCVRLRLFSVCFFCFCFVLFCFVLFLSSRLVEVDKPEFRLAKSRLV